MSEFTGKTEYEDRLEARIEELEAFAAHVYRHAWSGPLRGYAAALLNLDPDGYDDTEEYENG